MPAKKGLNIDTAVATEKLPTTVEPSQYLQSLGDVAAALQQPSTPKLEDVKNVEIDEDTTTEDTATDTTTDTITDTTTEDTATDTTTDTITDTTTDTITDTTTDTITDTTTKDTDIPMPTPAVTTRKAKVKAGTKNLITPPKSVVTPTTVENEKPIDAGVQILGKIVKDKLLHVRIIGKETTYKLDLSDPNQVVLRDKIMQQALAEDKKLEMYPMVGVIIKNPKFGETRNGKPYSEYIQVGASIATGVPRFAVTDKGLKARLVARKIVRTNVEGQEYNLTRYTVIALVK